MHGTHTDVAIEQIGIQAEPDPNTEGDREDVIEAAMALGWVRGAVDSEEGMLVQGQNWNLVRATARFILPQVNFDITRYTLDIPGQSLTLDRDQFEQFLKGRVRGFVTEATRVISVERSWDSRKHGDGFHKIPLLIDPSSEEVAAILVGAQYKEARFILSDHLYVWRGESALHDAVMSALQREWSYSDISGSVISGIPPRLVCKDGEENEAKLLTDARFRRAFPELAPGLTETTMVGANRA